MVSQGGTLVGLHSSLDRQTEYCGDEMRHIIPISGKDSCATMIVQRTMSPNLNYEIVFTDNKSELPETYAWLNDVEKKLGVSIHRVGSSLIDIIYKWDILPSPRRRFCTKESKIFPMEDWIGPEPAILYLGIRADEDRISFNPTRKQISIKYPLIEAGIGIAAVYKILESHRVQPPAFFWNRLYDAVIARLKRQRKGFGLIKPGFDRLIEMSQWQKDAIFAWRSRSNCYHCFYQRRYEWVGLLEHHPKLFDEAERLETEVGSLLQRPYYWIGRDYPLSKIRKNAQVIFNKRVVAATNLIQNFQIDLDELSRKSCGLFCGK